MGGLEGHHAVGNHVSEESGEVVGVSREWLEGDGVEVEIRSPVPPQQLESGCVTHHHRHVVVIVYW